MKLRTLVYPFVAAILTFSMSNGALAQATGSRPFKISNPGGTVTTPQLWIDNKPYIDIKLTGYKFQADRPYKVTSSRFNVTVYAKKYGWSFPLVIANQTFKANESFQSSTFSAARLPSGYYYYAIVKRLDDGAGAVIGSIEVMGR